MEMISGSVIGVLLGIILFLTYKLNQYLKYLKESYDVLSKLDVAAREYLRLVKEKQTNDPLILQNAQAQLAKGLYDN